MVITEGDGSIAYFYKDGGDWINPDGDFTHLASGGSPTKWTRTYPDGTEVVFPDPSTGTGERMESVEDRFGNETTYTYDVNDHLDLITDPAGKEIDFVYTDSTKVEIKDPGSTTRITTLTIDNDGDLTTIKDPASKNVLVATYDSDHRMKRRTDRRGGVWGFAYDDFGKLAADTMPQVYADGSNQKPIVEFHSLEAELLKGGGGLGTLASPLIPLVATSVRAEVDDPDGNTTKYELSRLGPAEEVDPPVGTSTHFTIDSDGRATTISPASGGQHTVYYASGTSRMTSQNDLASKITYYKYSDSAAFPDTLFALPDSIYGAAVPNQGLTWNSRGELTSRWVGSASNDTDYTYDTKGRVLTITDPEDHVTTYFYPDTTSAGFWNVDSVTVEDRTTKFGYDAYGRRTTVTAPNGDVTTTAFDDINRIDKVTAPDLGVTDYTYDDLYLTQIKDAINQTYDYTVNALGWVTEREDPRSESDTYAYDILGRVTTWTDRLGRDFDYEYDAVGNLELVIADGDSVVYNIDPDGDFYSVDNGASRDSITFDNLGRVTNHWTFRGNDTVRLASGYNSKGPRSSVTMHKPWSRSIGYTIDGWGQLSTLNDLNGDNTSMTFNSDRQATQVSFPAGTRQLEFPSTHKTGGVTWAQTLLDDAFGFELHQDAMKRIDERHWVGVDTTRFYYYDGNSRLTRYEDWEFDSSGCTDDDDRGHACVDLNMVFSDSAHYSFDKVGNRTDHGSSVSSGNRISGINGYTLTWDDGGFLTQKSKTGFTQNFYWNAQGQLDSVSTDGTKTRFKYDGLGRRTQKDADGTITNYIHDGDDLLMELDSSFEIVAEYTHFPGTDQLHSMIRDSAIYYFATDEKGTVLGLYDTLGIVQNTYRYDPWGNPESESEKRHEPVQVHR